MVKLNYKHLNYFLTVAKQGSITKACDILHVTPQTISGQITAMESAIGHTLFERVGRSLKVTETGHIVMRYAEDIFELGGELSDILSGAPSVSSSLFKVSAASGIPKTIVAKIIEPALNLSKEMRLECKEAPIKSLLGDLAIHEVDMVLTDSPVSSEFSIKAHSHFLGEPGLSFFCANSIAANLSGQFPFSLNNQPMLLPTKQYAIRQLFERWITENDVFPTTRGEFDDSALMKSFGQSGEGIFFMPTAIEHSICSNFNVQCIGRTNEIKQRFYAISAQRNVKHPAIAAILEAAKDEIFK